MEDDRTEAEREIDDLDGTDVAAGPDQDLDEAEEMNEELANLPDEIERADERYDLDGETKQAEGAIFKLAMLIAAVVIVILLVVAVIWIF